MLMPSVRLTEERGILVAEFWDCLRLDPQPVKDLREHYEEHVRSTGRADLVVDFHGVSFAGSSALSGFIAIRKACLTAGGRLALCMLEPAVRDAFHLLRLDPLFRFHETRQEALESMHSVDGSAPAPKEKARGGGMPAPPLRARRKPG